MTVCGVAYTNHGEQPRLSCLRTNNGLEVDLIIEGPNLRPLPVEIKLSRTPTASLATGLTRFAGLFAEANPENGLLLCLADGESPIGRTTKAVGVMGYLNILSGRLAY